MNNFKTLSHLGRILSALKQNIYKLLNIVWNFMKEVYYYLAGFTFKKFIYLVLFSLAIRLFMVYGAHMLSIDILYLIYFRLLQLIIGLLFIYYINKNLRKRMLVKLTGNFIILSFFWCFVWYIIGYYSLNIYVPLLFASISNELRTNYPDLCIKYDCWKIYLKYCFGIKYNLFSNIIVNEFMPVVKNNPLQHPIESIKSVYTKISDWWNGDPNIRPIKHRDFWDAPQSKPFPDFVLHGLKNLDVIKKYDYSQIKDLTHVKNYDFVVEQIDALSRGLSAVRPQRYIPSPNGPIDGFLLKKTPEIDYCYNSKENIVTVKDRSQYNEVLSQIKLNGSTFTSMINYYNNCLAEQYKKTNSEIKVIHCIYDHIKASLTFEERNYLAFEFMHTVRQNPANFFLGVPIFGENTCNLMEDAETLRSAINGFRKLLPHLLVNKLSFSETLSGLPTEEELDNINYWRQRKLNDEFKKINQPIINYLDGEILFRVLIKEYFDKAGELHNIWFKINMHLDVCRYPNVLANFLNYYRTDVPIVGLQELICAEAYNRVRYLEGRPYDVKFISKFNNDKAYIDKMKYDIDAWTRIRKDMRDIMDKVAKYYWYKKFMAHGVNLQLAPYKLDLNGGGWLFGLYHPRSLLYLANAYAHEEHYHSYMKDTEYRSLEETTRLNTCFKSYMDKTYKSLEIRRKCDLYNFNKNYWAENKNKCMYKDFSIYKDLKQSSSGKNLSLKWLLPKK